MASTHAPAGDNNVRLPALLSALAIAILGSGLLFFNLPLMAIILIAVVGLVGGVCTADNGDNTRQRVCGIVLALLNFALVVAWLVAHP